QVFRALGVEDVGGVAAGEQREDDLGVEGRLQVGLGLLGCGEPPFDIGDAGFGDRVPLPLGAAAGLDAVDFDEPVLQQAGHRRVDLAVVQRPVVTELLVEGPLEVVTVARAGLQEPQEGVTDGHGEHSTHRVYAVCIRRVCSPSRRVSPTWWEPVVTVLSPRRRRPRPGARRAGPGGSAGVAVPLSPAPVPAPADPAPRPGADGPGEGSAGPRPAAGPPPPARAAGGTRSGRWPNGTRRSPTAPVPRTPADPAAAAPACAAAARAAGTLPRGSPT